MGLRYPCGRRGGDVRATAPVVRPLIADAFSSLRVRHRLMTVALTQEAGSATTPKSPRPSSTVLRLFLCSPDERSESGIVSSSGAAFPDSLRSSGLRRLRQETSARETQFHSLLPPCSLCSPW